MGFLVCRFLLQGGVMDKGTHKGAILGWSRRFLHPAELNSRVAPQDTARFRPAQTLGCVFGGNHNWVERVRNERGKRYNKRLKGITAIYWLQARYILWRLHWSSAGETDRIDFDQRPDLDCPKRERNKGTIWSMRCPTGTLMIYLLYIAAVNCRKVVWHDCLRWPWTSRSMRTERSSVSGFISKFIFPS